MIFVSAFNNFKTVQLYLYTHIKYTTNRLCFIYFSSYFNRLANLIINYNNKTYTTNNLTF